MPPKFTKTLKAHFGLQSRGRPLNADLQRLFGTTDYQVAADRARTQLIADKDAQRVSAYQRKKDYNKERNQKLRAAQCADAQQGYFNISELPRRLESALLRLPGYNPRFPFTFTLALVLSATWYHLPLGYQTLKCTL